MKLRNPVPAGRIGNKFGYRPSIKVGSTWTSTFHGGLDVVAAAGTPVYAAAAGVVVAPPYNSSAGIAVVIRHAGIPGVEGTGYAHLSRRVVAPGDRVTTGQLIGYVGATGLATGPHLHLDVFSNIAAFQRIDPAPLIGASTPKKGFPMALTDKQQRTMAAKIDTVAYAVDKIILPALGRIDRSRGPLQAEIADVQEQLASLDADGLHVDATALAADLVESLGGELAGQVADELAKRLKGSA